MSTGRLVRPVREPETVRRVASSRPKVRPPSDGPASFSALLPSEQDARRRASTRELKFGKFPARVRRQDELYFNAVDEQLRLGDDRESVGIILCTDRNETVAKLALHRVYAPIAVSTWTTDRPARELPAVEITDNVPADLQELAELDTVRARLIDRVAHHGARLATQDGEGTS